MRLFRPSPGLPEVRSSEPSETTSASETTVCSIVTSAMSLTFCSNSPMYRASPSIHRKAPGVVAAMKATVSPMGGQRQRA
jgi:hypothetical protein